MRWRFECLPACEPLILQALEKVERETWLTAAEHGDHLVRVRNKAYSKADPGIQEMGKIRNEEALSYADWCKEQAKAAR